MSGRGGRDRFRRDYAIPPGQSPSTSSARFSDKSRPVNPPSRHLWVGNLSNHVTESVLADHFLRFGELESLAFQPGRSYAFVNFMTDEDAIAAMDSLQGFTVSGAALRIEFAKADKMPAPHRDDNYLHRRDEQRSTNRNSPFSQRESRMNHGDADDLLPASSRVSDNTAESPSEVLWIGFPTFLKVDEATLRKAFSPFGEIEKITVFQGRNYAFVRFRSLTSACRAKETLQGKLFGTPRVHICFARSETGSSSTGRWNARIDSPPNHRPNGRAGSSDDFRMDRNFRNLAEDVNSRARYMLREPDYGDPDVMSLGRRDPLRASGNVAYEQRRIHDMGPEMGPSDDLRGYHNVPSRDGSQYHEFSPPKFPQRSSFHEEPWDLPEDPHLYREAKKLRTAPPPENELPEYPFSDLDRGKHSFRQVLSDFPHDEAEPLGYRRIPDHAKNLNRPFVERNDLMMAPRDSFQSTSGTFSANLLDQKRITPDLPHSSMNQEWKWEGTIAKGGNAICRARCFPVGKVLDIMLPQFLDCTARTGLDMLAKHYYQASGTWVVFFVPQSDADISYYNEFMNYLGEKQRAAVAKLDDKNTLFLVPPSEFSEKVLKVPGKLSISGVVLRLEPPTSNVHSLPPTQERKDVNPMPFHSDVLYPKSEPPSGVAFPPVFSSPNLGKPAFANTSALLPQISGYDHARMPDSAEGGHDYPPNHHPAGLQPNLASQHLNPVSGPSTISLMNQGPINSINQEYNSGLQRSGQDAHIGAHYNSSRATALPSSGMMRPMAEESKLPASLATSSGALQPDQLAQLAALLGQQQRQPGSSSAAGEERPSGLMGQPEIPLVAQRYTPAQATQAPPGFAGMPQFQQPQPQPQQQQVGSNTVTAPGAQDAAEADPQKRLQATLQLAAALLQQIQQGKGT